MNPTTGAIAQFETDEDAVAAGYTVPLTIEEAERLKPLARAERRAVLSQRASALMDRLVSRLPEAPSLDAAKEAVYAAAVKAEEGAGE